MVLINFSVVNAHLKGNGKHEALELFISKRALKQGKNTKPNSLNKKFKLFSR